MKKNHRDTAASPTSEQHRGIPVIWLAFDFFAWLRVLIRYRFKISWRQLPVALAITLISLGQTLLRFIEYALMGVKVARTPITQPPVFILGHWRSGTTMLHELLALDARFTYPTTYECFSPHHFLITERLLTPLIARIMPAKRIQDNMDAGLDRPQEDEIALGMLGVVSPYVSHGFPRQLRRHLDFFTLESIPPRERRRWEQAFTWFLKKITLARPRAIVLKSPTHTFRIPTLLRLFPRARFINIVRNPYEVFPSTVHLWKTLTKTFSFQPIDFTGLDDYVFDVFNRMHDSFEANRHLIPASQFCEIRYEDLVRDPVGQMRTVYASLGLPDFERVLPELTAYCASIAGHKKNRYSLAPEVRAAITRRWSAFIAQYGYADPED